MLTLSICIPSYNRFDSLRKNLDLILKSTSKDFEVVIVDNGSEKDIMQELKSQDPRVRIIKRDKVVSGPRNINECITFAQGKYALLCIDKNYVLGKSLNKFISFLNENPDLAGGICSYYMTEKEAYQKSKCVAKKYKESPIAKFGYLSKHPTGNFYLTECVKNEWKSSLELEKENTFGYDLLLSACALYGSMVKYDFPLLFSEAGILEERKKSYTFSGKTQNLYFLPENVIQQFFLYCQHLKRHPCNGIVYVRLILHLYRLTLCHVSIDYRDFITNPNACTHYHIRPVESIKKADLLNYCRKLNISFWQSNAVESKLCKIFVIVITNIGFFIDKWKKF